MVYLKNIIYITQRSSLLSTCLISFVVQVNQSENRVEAIKRFSFFTQFLFKMLEKCDKILWLNLNFSKQNGV